MGKQHIKAISKCPDAQLCCIIDPNLGAEVLAESQGVPWYNDLLLSIDEVDPDAIIIASPNQLHEQHACESIAQNIPVLIEKPIANSSQSAKRIIVTAEKHGVPVLVGHHRRHSTVTATIKKQIEEGLVGKIIAVQGTCWLFKPEDYFAEEWRTQTGAGPLAINLIHDIDLFCHLVGKVVAVSAISSSRNRGFEIEDTAILLLEFENGALGTLSVSDTIVAPWSWELTSGENEAYPRTDQFCYTIGGTHGSLAAPGNTYWWNPDQRGWWEDIKSKRIESRLENPLDQQIQHFCNVVNGREKPLVSGQDGLIALEILEAIYRSATSGQKEYLPV